MCLVFWTIVYMYNSMLYKKGFMHSERVSFCIFINATLSMKRSRWLEAAYYSVSNFVTRRIEVSIWNLSNLLSRVFRR